MAWVLLSCPGPNGRHSGKTLPSLRLVCVEANLRLREYSASLGFREVGRGDFDGPWYSATLSEKTPAVLLAAGVPLG